MIHRIAILGPESTGKSNLCRSLSKHYKDIWVPEFARTYLEQIDRNYNYEDLLTIAQGQKESEDILSNAARSILFCDTTLLTIKIWSEFKFGRCDCWILDTLEQQKYALTLLCDIDLAWQEDVLRENPHDREELLEIHKKELLYYEQDFVVVSGTGEERTRSAIEHIEEFLQVS